jgi:hypothetical protein
MSDNKKYKGIKCGGMCEHYIGNTENPKNCTDCDNHVKCKSTVLNFLGVE